tara:strand:+ start:1680 stop:2921 length:1242 start_codon:yes stop_codon:yes gene_type:complete
MAVPTLTPTSTTSAIVLTSTGSAADVAASLPLGVYSSSEQFLSGAAAQVAYTYKKLGGDVLDIELTPSNVYANYEEAVLEYSYIMNLFQSKNVLSDALGSATASFDHKGETTAGTGSATKYHNFTFDYYLKMGEKFSHEAGIGGSTPIYSASFDTVNEQSDYDLQAIVSASAAAGGVPYASINRNKKIIVREVFYKTPYQMWRFYGYYGGLNVVGNYHDYGQYSDQSTFQVIPAWHNKMQAISYEDHLYTRTSHYSYEIINNKLRLYPQPDSVSPAKWWFRFSIRDDVFGETTDPSSGGVNNMNNLPFENIPYASINSIGKQWIRRFALALSKETLGQIRGKFGGNVPIPGDNIQLNASDLLSQAKEEQTALRDELKEILESVTYDKLTETDKNMTDNQQAIITKVPMKIFVG